jgi:hypothetical protein
MSCRSLLSSGVNSVLGRLNQSGPAVTLSCRIDQLANEDRNSVVSENQDDDCVDAQSNYENEGSH